MSCSLFVLEYCRMQYWTIKNKKNILIHLRNTLNIVVSRPRRRKYKSVKGQRNVGGQIGRAENWNYTIDCTT